jgi:hypothetical protein
MGRRGREIPEARAAVRLSRDKVEASLEVVHELEAVKAVSELTRLLS